jgi:hypothetical protein
MAGKSGKCASCGEVSEAIYQFGGKDRCNDCYLELAYGVVMPQHAELFPSGAGCPMEGRRGESASPGQENAIRHMEG